MPLKRQPVGKDSRLWRGLRMAVALSAALWVLGDGPGVCRGDKPAAGLVRIGAVTHPPVKEASALVASRRQEGVLWTLCDSRNLAQLYAIDRSGRLLGEFDVEGGVNLDWESLSIDDAGHLFVADVGNNLRVPMRWVYQLSEPDVPAAPPAAAAGSEVSGQTGSVRVEKAFAYTFPGEPFDVEGTFVRGNAIYLVSKEPENARLWSLPITESGPVELTLECELPELNRATGADISADGNQLAICTYEDVVLYRLTSAEDGRLRLERGSAIPFEAAKVEGCCWSGDDVLLISEDRSIYRLSLPEPPSLPAAR